MFRTLRVKLVLSYAAISALSLMLALLVTFALASDYAQKSGFRTLQEKRALALPYVQLVIREQRASGPIRDVRQTLSTLRENIRRSHMRLFLVDSQTMLVEEDTARQANIIGQKFPLDDTRPDFEQALDTGIEGSTHLPGETTRVQYVAQRLPLGPRPSDAPVPPRGQPDRYVLIVAQPQPGLRDIVEQARGYIWPAVVISLLASLAVAYLLARSISRPISRLSMTAAAIARGEYHHHVPVEGHGELALLSREFNNMAEEISRSHQVQRDFIANVSHDLKTPLTSIQGFSQAMLEGAVRDEAGYRQAAQIINVEAERMSRLVSQLLSLSRLQSGLASMEMRPIEPGPLLAQLVLATQPLAAEARVELVFKADQPGGIVLADADRLREAFSNLIENAIKYTPEDGTVTLQTTHKRSEIEVAVIDTGQGIPPEDLPRVTERFYQVDKSRAPDARQSVGLGLAIAREVVLAHQGKLEIESSPGVGTTVRVTLPSLHGEGVSKPLPHSLKRHKAATSPTYPPHKQEIRHNHGQNGHDDAVILASPDEAAHEG